jgi:hypothetical protein
MPKRLTLHRREPSTVFLRNSRPKAPLRKRSSVSSLTIAKDMAPENTGVSSSNLGKEALATPGSITPSITPSSFAGARDPAPHYTTSESSVIEPLIDRSRGATRQPSSIRQGSNASTTSSHRRRRNKGKGRPALPDNQAASPQNLLADTNTANTGTGNRYDNNASIGGSPPRKINIDQLLRSNKATSRAIEIVAHAISKLSDRPALVQIMITTTTPYTIGNTFNSANITRFLNE